MKTLDEIAIEHGTDKGTRHPLYAGHGYAPLYDEVFSPLRELEIKFLEIGVGGGESIRTWLEYFPKAKVFGVDIVHSTNPWNTVSPDAHERYHFATGDQSSDVFWKCFLADYGTDWNVIVDDGGHCNYQIIPTFEALWPHIKPGGYYCIEDLGVGYGVGSVFVRKDFPRHMDFIHTMMDQMNQGQENRDQMYFARELAIFRKKK